MPPRQECMAEAGHEMLVSFDGGMGPSPDMPADQSDAWELAFYICVAQYPVDQTLFKQYGREQVDLLYAYYVDELVPCLTREGYENPEIPSLETFRASWIDTDSGVAVTDTTWGPYDVVDIGAQNNWEALNLKCPQGPSDEYLFPEN